MTTVAIDERSDLWRWAASAVVVLGLHATGAGVLLAWREPIAVGDSPDVVMFDLAPVNAASDTIEDVPPGPKQEEAEAPPPPKQEVERKQEEKVDVPPSPAPAVAALPPPEPVAPKPPEPSPVPPAPATTAPPRMHASQGEINMWGREIATRIQRSLIYPRAARDRGEIGVAELAFSIDREGHVVSSTIVKSSGYAELDRESIATVRRAQPFPKPPAGADGDTFQFKVPVKFNIR